MVKCTVFIISQLYSDTSQNNKKRTPLAESKDVAILSQFVYQVKIFSISSFSPLLWKRRAGEDLLSFPSPLRGEAWVGGSLSTSCHFEDGSEQQFRASEELVAICRKDERKNHSVLLLHKPNWQEPVIHG
jgi:hypothetical protein